MIAYAFSELAHYLTAAGLRLKFKCMKELWFKE